MQYPMFSRRRKISRAVARRTVKGTERRELLFKSKSCEGMANLEHTVVVNET